MEWLKILFYLLQIGQVFHKKVVGMEILYQTVI